MYSQIIKVALCNDTLFFVIKTKFFYELVTVVLYFFATRI